MDRKQSRKAVIVHCRKARTRELRAHQLVLVPVDPSSDRCQWALVTERPYSQHVGLLSPRRKSHVYALTIAPPRESRMREIRQSGSEGGGGRKASPYP